MSIPPRVVLVIDKPGWAFAHIATALHKHLGAEFELTTVRYHDVFAGVYRPPGAVDLTVSFWWPTNPRVVELLRPRRSLVCLFDGYSTREPQGRAEFARAVGGSSVAVVNEAFAARAPAGRLVGVVEDAIDCEMFVPRLLPATFTVGWTGSSGGQVTVDRKGLALLRDACALAKVPLVMHDATAPGGKVLVHAAMPTWYGGISVYACASEMEGGPNPVLEAMACGRPVVSTACGLVPRLAVHVVERTAEAFAAGIVYLRDLPRAQLEAMGADARAMALQHDRAVKIYQWRDALNGALNAPA